MGATEQAFRFRLTSHTRVPGLFRLDKNETSFELPDGHTVHIVARDGDDLRSASKLHFEAGGYLTEQEARNAGEHLRLRLRVLNATLSLGLDVPVDDTVSGQLGAEFKQEVERKHSVTILSNVRGLLVFPDDGQHGEFAMDGHAEVYPSDSGYWLDGLRQLWDADINLNERSEDALSLLNLASLEPSARSAFLVTYLALERLLPSKKRSRPSLILLERLKLTVLRASKRKRNPIASAEKDALLGSLGRLEYESFGNTLKRVASANQAYDVEGVPLRAFLDRCTSVRHKTAHPATFTQPPDYALLTRGMRNLAIAILWNTHGIKDLSFHRPGDQISFPKGEIQARIFTYSRR